MLKLAIVLVCASTPGGLAPASDTCSLGAEALRGRDLNAAERLLKQCVQQQPNRLDSYLLLCGVYQQQGNAASLYEIALDGLKMFPREKRFYLTVANHEGRDKRYEQAIRVLDEGVRRWPDDSKIRSLLASAHFGRGTELLDAAQTGRAAEHLRQATQLAPSDAEAHLNLGRALHNLLRNTEALAAFNRVLEINPSMPLARFHRGMSFYALGEFDRAFDDFNREIKANPDYPPAYLTRGLALLANGEPEKSLLDFEIAVTRLPDNATAQHARARALVQLGKLEQAESSLRTAMALEPSDPAPVNTLVSVLLRLNRRAEAEPLGRKAADLAQMKRSAGPGEIQFQHPRRPPQ